MALPRAALVIGPALLALALAVLGLVATSNAAALNRTTALVSKPTGVADPNSGDVDFSATSADGKRAFLSTTQKLTAEDTDGGDGDVYERFGGTTVLISKATGAVDPGNAAAVLTGISKDGRRAFFETTQRMTADDQDSGVTDVYERFGGTTTLISQPDGVADPNTFGANLVGLSEDGTRAFFDSTGKFTGEDTDPSLTDVYERSAGDTTLVSQPETGLADPNSHDVTFAGASADGSRVFLQTAQQLTTGDVDTARTDVYERTGGATTLVSQPTGVADPNSDDAFFGGASRDGSQVFLSTTQKLTADDFDTNRIDAYERSGGTTT